MVCDAATAALLVSEPLEEPVAFAPSDGLSVALSEAVADEATAWVVEAEVESLRVVEAATA